MRNRSLIGRASARQRRRVKGVARLFVLSAAFAASTAAGVGVAVPAAASPAQAAANRSAQRYRFDIPVGTIGAAAAAFEAVTGLTVAVADDQYRDLPSPGVVGTFTPQQALERMLSGTGIGFVFTDDRTVTLDLRTSEFVAVEGLQPRAIESPKFAAPLVDTPQSIVVVPNELFIQQGAQNLTDVLRNTPGITFNAGENGFSTGTSNFSLRGFDTSGSVFVDNARDSGNYFRDIYNVEQVETIKGPSGDNGRSSAGGYINLVTKAPRVGNFRTGTLSYGADGHDSDGRVRGMFDINQQIGTGTAVRFNALWQDGGVPARNLAGRQNWGVAPSVGFGLDGATRVYLWYQHLEQAATPDWGVPGALIDGMITYNASAGAEANRTRFYGHQDDYDDVSSDSAMARVEHDFSPGLRLFNQTRWSGTDREALYTVPTAYVAATRTVTTQRQAFSRDNTAFSNLTNLTSAFQTGSLRHAVTSGLEFAFERSSADRFPTNGVLGNPGSTPVDAPDPARPLAGFVGLVPIQTADVEVGTVAAYVYDTVQLSSQWQLTGGLRVERYDVTIESRTAAGAPQGPDGYDRDDVTVSGKAGVVYKPARQGSVYAAVGLAALPPASYLSNPDISRDGDNAFPGWSAGPNNATSKVQQSTNFEVGTKWDLQGGRFSTTAAYFRTHRHNIAMAGTVDGVANTFAGYGEQIVQGVELGAVGNITPAWSLFGGLLFMDSERRHGPEVDAARLAANPGDYGTATTTNGDELAFMPNVSANLWTTYRLPFPLTLGGGLQYQGESYLGRPDDAERIIPNGNAGVLPAYTVVNLLATYQINRGLTLRFNADNVFDEFYGVAPNWNGTRMSIGPGRAFLVSADLGF